MSSTIKDSGKKWIQTSVAICCILLGFVLISFFTQLGEWFDLESKVKNYQLIHNVVSVLLSIGVFAYIMKNDVTRSFLEEVYTEGTKVVWPDKNETVKHTFVIMIGVTIVGYLLWVFDLISNWALMAIRDLF